MGGGVQGPLSLLGRKGALHQGEGVAETGRGETLPKADSRILGKSGSSPWDLRGAGRGALSWDELCRDNEDLPEKGSPGNSIDAQ